MKRLISVLPKIFSSLFGFFPFKFEELDRNVHFERFSNISFPTLGTAPRVFCQAPNASFKLVGQHVTWRPSNDWNQGDHGWSNSEKMYQNVKCTAFGRLLLSFFNAILANCNSGHGLRAMLSLKHVGQILQVVNFRHVSFSFGEHPETTTWWWWWWWWIWRISLVLMAIPEVICFRVVTQDLSYNYICRRWTPNWGCPCRKQYVLLQETMAQTAQAACALDMSCVSWADEKLIGRMLDSYPVRQSGQI